MRPARSLSKHARHPFKPHVPAKGPEIFTNSLEKTLGAHRDANRAGLIRKVYPREPSPALWRPQLRPEVYAGYSPPTAAASSILDNPEPEPTAVKPERKVRRRKRNDLDSLVSRLSSQRSTLDLIHGVQPGQSPWLAHVEQSPAHDEATARLDAEIRALDRHLTLRPREQKVVERLTAEVGDLLDRHILSADPPTGLPFTTKSMRKSFDLNPQITNSRRTGLALPHSGAHFVFPVKHQERSGRPFVLTAHLNPRLRLVEHVLRTSSAFEQVHFVRKSVPILSARHQKTGLQLHFSFENFPRLMDEYLQTSQAEFPSLRPLYVATRTLLEARGLFGPANSGIGANALAVLVIAFLKMNCDRFVGPHRLGEQLLAFLHFYGSEVDLQTVGVAADPPGFFGAQKMHRPKQGEEPAFHRGQRSIMNARSTVATKQNIRFLCIQDPTQFMRNLGRSCARIAELQSVFAASHESLQRTCNDWPSRRGESQFSILAPALQANFDELENFRERVASSTDVGLE
ncbi:hypothetical protein N7510_000998 [Penicillium lagena]|uniref:uncharacterized protein n=1 Tax=Penicillium lagena TaxID=94218 RepID=UPI00253FF739|nr:uncharacterized protein N7510_000998 [Penicillium lagena]KAJ5624689.1 hypothetical protein N7510_000998 [Penicillium lagena]